MKRPVIDAAHLAAFDQAWQSVQETYERIEETFRQWVAQDEVESLPPENAICALIYALANHVSKDLLAASLAVAIVKRVRDE